MLKAVSIGLAAASVWVCDGLRQAPRASGWVRDGVRCGARDPARAGGGALPPDFLTGLSVRYRLDDSGEDTAVASDVPGVPAAVSTGPASGFSVPGQIGAAFDFSAAGSGVYLADAGTYLPMGASARTVTCWMKWNGSSFGMGYVWSFPGDQTLYEHHCFYLHASQGASGVSLNLSAFFYDLDVSDVIPDGAWHLVACTYDGAATARIYVDGAEVGNATGWTEVDTRPGGGAYGARLQIGQDFVDSLDRPWPGHVDDFRVYAACLDEAAIQAIVLAAGGTVASPAAPAPAGPVLHFDLNGGDSADFWSAALSEEGCWYGENCSYTFPGAYKEGYTLYGWNTSSDGEGFYVGPWDWYSGGGDVTLYAIFTEN